MPTVHFREKKFEKKILSKKNFLFWVLSLPVWAFVRPVSHSNIILVYFIVWYCFNRLWGDCGRFVLKSLFFVFLCCNFAVVKFSLIIRIVIIYLWS